MLGETPKSIASIIAGMHYETEDHRVVGQALRICRQTMLEDPAGVHAHRGMQGAYGCF